MTLEQLLCSVTDQKVREFEIAFETLEASADKQRYSAKLGLAANTVFALVEFGRLRNADLSPNSRELLDNLENRVIARLQVAREYKDDYDASIRKVAPIIHRQSGISKTLDVLNGLLSNYTQFSVKAVGGDKFDIAANDIDEDEFRAILKAYDADGYARARKVDAFGRHEMLDRTHCVSVMLQELLLDRNDMPENLRKSLEDASSALGEAYQIAGNIEVEE